MNKTLIMHNGINLVEICVGDEEILIHSSKFFRRHQTRTLKPNTYKTIKQLAKETVTNFRDNGYVGMPSFAVITRDRGIQSNIKHTLSVKLKTDTFSDLVKFTQKYSSCLNGNTLTTSQNDLWLTVTVGKSSMMFSKDSLDEGAINFTLDLCTHPSLATYLLCLVSHFECAIQNNDLEDVDLYRVGNSVNDIHFPKEHVEILKEHNFPFFEPIKISSPFKLLEQ